MLELKAHPWCTKKCHVMYTSLLQRISFQVSTLACWIEPTWVLLGMVWTYTPWWFLLDVIFHFCPPMGTIKTMVFHLSTSWVLLGPWFSVFPENSQAGSTVQKHVWYYWDHGFSFKHPMGTIRTMVFCLSHMWVLLRPWFSKKHSNCCYSTHGFNSAGKSISLDRASGLESTIKNAYKGGTL